jgi:AcrR family transcriptional regulator
MEGKLAHQPAASAPAAVSGRSIATRAKLISVAEMLFATRGVQAVSLNEINKAAEQRHGSACQYHFGNKDGLIQAILDKHVPPIAEQRNVLFDAMEREGGAPRLEQVVRAFVRPVAAKLLDPDGGKEFIRLNAQLVATHSAPVGAEVQVLFRAPQTGRLHRMLELAMRQRKIPPHVSARRLILAAVMLYHGLADYSHVLEATGGLDPEQVEHFSRDLEAMILGALVAPFDKREQADGK